jgi:hypothetical protein
MVLAIYVVHKTEYKFYFLDIVLMYIMYTLALVAPTRNEIFIWLFKKKMTIFINLISTSLKRHTELHSV